MKKIYLFFILLFFNNYLHAANLSNFETKIIGNKNLDKEYIDSILDVSIELTEKDLANYVIKELFATGYFESVTAEIINNELIINLKENPIISKIKFYGNDRFKDSDLQKIIDESFPDINIYNKSNINNITKTIEQYYKVYGYNLIKINVTTDTTSSGTIDINLNINEGEITKIKKINIIGNNAFSVRKIKSILRSSETRFYKIISGSSKYNENLVIFDERRIEDYYQNRGFKNISVNSSVSEFIKDTNKVILTYFIEEGNKYTIDNIDIRFDNNVNQEDIIIDENLIEDLEIKVGKTYKKNKINNSSNKIYNYLKTQGLVFIDVSTIELEKEDKIDLTFLISEIPESYVSEVNIEGNLRTKDEVIRREMELIEGDPYIPASIKKSKKNLNKLNFFNKVNIKTSQDDNKVDLNVEVEEKSTGQFNIGVTVDSYSGASLGSGLQESNLFGDGRFASLSFNTSDEAAGINIDIVEPYIFNKKINLLYNLNAQSKDFSNSSGYKMDTQTVGIGARYVFLENLTHYIKLDYVIDEIHGVKSSATDSIKNMSGDNIEYRFSNRLVYNNTDTLFRPSEGFVTKWFNKIAIDNYFLNRITYDRYFNYEKKVLSFRSQIGNITSLASGDVSDSNKFSLGGRNLRGFDRRGVGPRKSSTSYIGGNNIITSQIDYSIPISESTTNLVDFVSFFDAGTVFDNDEQPTHSKETIRVSTGLGINLNTGIGPLSFTYAIPLESESYDKERKFVFSIGWVN